MNYHEAIRFLYDLRVFGLKFGLENTRALAAFAGNPQEKLRFIHVAGTNGKGSTCAMLESIYRAAGLRVGLFTSPHLVSFGERIQVNRHPISQEGVTRLVEELKPAPGFSSSEGCPTFFEVVTVMALKYFAEQKCDLVIWETGMGGRLDATNIVTPLASLITNVQLDHQQWLGETLPEIAREKAGIIKPGIPVITSAEGLEVLRVITDAAKERPAPLRVVSGAMNDFEVGLAGVHQRKNAALAVATVQALQAQIPVSESQLQRGLKETRWAGRWQRIQRDNGQIVLLDGAHNPAGAQTVADSWRREFPEAKCALVLGMMRDKDAAAVCNILAPLANKIFLVPVSSERTSDPHSLVPYCRAANPDAEIHACQNLADAFAHTASESRVLLTGSLYFVGEALEWLGAISGAQERSLNEYGGPVRAVTFDVGGTLIEPWPSVGHVYAEVAARHGITVSPELLNQRFVAAWKAKKNFAYSKADWAELVDRTFDGLAPVGQVGNFFPELYETFVNASAWHVHEDVRPCLEQLLQHGLRLAAISNWDTRLRPLLAALKLDQYFDIIIVSGELGRHKPASEIFQAAAKALNTPARSILHVGDNMREDVEGARAVGFQALLLNRGPGGSAGAIASLSEVVDKIA